MIKEKHEKGPDGSSTTVKDESTNSDKNIDNSDTRIKVDEETATSSCSSSNINKDCSRNFTKNGANNVIGSTNTGSLHNLVEHKDQHLLENVTDDGIQDDSSILGLKTDENLESGKDALNNLGMTTGVVIAPQPPPPDGVQPLTSNVINKQTNNMEVQYMQQQSQIFVFSTLLANKGADAVLQGHFPSIIAYHCAQPGTKKYLEKNPLKITQFNRHNPAQWLNNLAMIKNKGCTRGPGVVNKGPPNIDGFDGLDDMVALSDANISWEQKNNPHGMDGLSNGGSLDVESPCLIRSSPGATVPTMSLGHSPIMTCTSAASPSLVNIQPSLQGVKVPDENLTPQQRQHREEQLATIRKMQQMLFPEHQVSGENQAVPVSEDQDVSVSATTVTTTGPGSNPSELATTSADIMSQQRVMLSNPNLVEWQKLRHQYNEERKIPTRNANSIMSRASSGPGPRLQGPPPPYHQTPRSASVPIALQSPSPASPNNPTSNLSLPSPRASSALNSPAEPGRSFSLNRHLSTGQSPNSQDSPSTSRCLITSNPGTPITSHLSPTNNIIAQDFPPTTSHQATDGMFGRTLQSIAQQKQQSISTSANKEPNLMPVPSPQQIQYLNTFEGQELTIQKQPNTSLKDGNIISPPMISTSVDNSFPGNTEMSSRLSCPNTPTSIDIAPRFPSTPVQSADGCRYQISSPQTTTAPTVSDKSQRAAGNSCLSPRTPTDCGAQFPTTSPHSVLDVHRFSGPNSNNVCPSSSPGPYSQQQQQQQQQQSKMPTFMNISPSNKIDLPVSTNYGCVRSDNVPLNPNSTNNITGNPKVSHFDPISSLAQMSQQLTNSVASSLNGQGGQGSAMMGYNSSGMHMMEPLHSIPELDAGPNPCTLLGVPMQNYHPNPSANSPMRSLSPKMNAPGPSPFPGIPRMMNRGGSGCNPYNGANVQVKPNAPNTIQYLPAKPQIGNTNPRGPPSLEFLHRFANPLSNLDSKMPTQNLQYFSNCVPGNGGLINHMDANPMNTEVMGGMMANGPMNNGGMMGPGPNMANMIGGPGMGMGMGPMLRGPGLRPMGMIRMQQMTCNDPMFPSPNMPNPNAQMFVAGPKSSPMGMSAPDASQPLPPSMGQSNNFKNSPFVGPTTADPNYAQQFHNFQQQLYATTTRSQMSNQAMGGGPGPGPPLSANQPYFVPK